MVSNASTSSASTGRQRVSASWWSRALARLGPQPGWVWRIMGAGGFLAACAAPYCAQAWSGWEGDDATGLVYFCLLLAAFFAAGCLIGRWWTVALLVLAPLVIWPLGVDPGDSDGWYYSSLFLFGPWLFGAPLLLLGLAIRTGVRWWRGEFAPEYAATERGLAG